MTWKDSMEEWGGGEIAFLSEDGECMMFIIVGDPRLIVGKFKGRETSRVGCPVIGLDGFTLLIVGKRLARRLAKYEDRFNEVAFTVVRRGEHDDIRTKYELSICPDEDITKRLFDWKDSEFDESVIAEAVEYAEQIANG